MTQTSFNPTRRFSEPVLYRVRLALNCLFIYGLLLAPGNYDWYIAPLRILQDPVQPAILARLMSALLGALLILLYFSFSRTDHEFWIYLLICFVPLEFSKKFFLLPKLSPLDYFCAIALLALATQVPWENLASQIRWAFGIWDLFFWAAFFAYCAVTARLLGGNPRGAFRWVGFLFFYLLAAIQTRKNPRFPLRICTLLSCLAAIVSMMGLHQFCKIPSYVRLEALFNQHNAFSAFLSLCIPAGWIYLRASSGAPRRIAQGFAVLTLVAFILAYSRGAWVGLVCGILGSHFLYRNFRRFPRISIRWILPCLVGVAALAALVVREPSSRGFLSPSYRNIYWDVGTAMVRSHPVLGLGPGNYQKQVFRYLNSHQKKAYLTDSQGNIIGMWQDLHNLYLQILVEDGAAGFLIWAGALVLMLWRAHCDVLRRSPRRIDLQPYLMISIIAFLIHNTVDIVTVNSFDMVFGVLLGIATFSSEADNVAVLSRGIDPVTIQ